MQMPIVATLTGVVLGLLAGAPAASAQGLIFCAQEGGFCRVPYPTAVVYGAGGRERSINVGPGGIPCSNDVFGDPAVGQRKHCSYVARGYGRSGYDRDDGRGGRWGREWADRGRRGYDDHPRRGYDDYYDDRPRGRGRDFAWSTCAGENGYCSFEGRRVVRYGAGGRFVERVVTNGVSCSNRVFGDPAVGQRKVCQVREGW